MGADRFSMLGWLPGESLRRAQLNERVEWELRGEIVGRLVREQSWAEFAHVVLALVLAGLVWDDLGSSAASLWPAAVVAASAWRLRVRLRLRRTGGPLERQLSRIRASVLLVALAWGLGAVLAAPYLPATHVLLVVVIFCALSAIAPLNLVADPPSFWRLTAALMLSLAVMLLRADLGGERLVALALLTLFAGSLARFYPRAHTQFVDALRTAKRFEFSEQEVARERAFLDALIASAPTAIAAVSRHGRVLGVNPAFERIFGYANATIVGQELDLLIVPEDRRGEARALAERVNAGEAVNAEGERMRADGQRVWVQLAAAPVQGIPQGGVFVLYQDITALRQADTARRDMETQYRQLVDAASDLVFQTDVAGRWTFLNEAAAQIYDRRPADMLGHPFAEVVHPDHVERDRATWREVLGGTEIVDRETVHLDHGGRSHVLSFNASPLRAPDGSVVGVYGMARDVTERAQAREALREARDQAERATSTKSAFLANMSHEIRTPLNGVLGMIALLLDSKLTREQRRQAELLRGSAETLMRIINDILDLSKVEAGRLDLESIAFDPAVVVEHVVELFRPKAGERGIQLMADMDRNVPPGLMGDPGRLRQVLSNLVSNAIKFTEEGSVTVVTRLHGTPDHQAQVRFVVRDTGIGIPAAAQQRIFDEFEQADVSTSRRYGGTGLGLTISRHLVARMGGTLDLASKEGAGSEFGFTLTLPVASEDVGRSAQAPAAVGRATTSRRVLLAEDNPVNQEVARQMLERRGHVVVVVPNGRLALDHVRHGEPFDVILMDIQMPDMDGLAATAAIRGLGGRGTLPIYAVSANASGAERERCLDAGMDGYLTKPFQPADLFRLVEEGGDAPVNLAAFRAQLAEAGVGESMPDMLALFQEDAPERLAALEQAVASGDARRIKAAAHAYKSSAGTIHAGRLAAALGELERVAEAEDLSRLTPLHAAVRRTHAEAMTYLEDGGHAA